MRQKEFMNGFFFCYFGVTSCTSAAQNFYTFFLLKKGTRIVQRAILKRDSFLMFKEDIYSLRVYSICMLIIMPHVNKRISFVWGGRRKKENWFLKPAKIWWIFSVHFREKNFLWLALDRIWLCKYNVIV